MKKENPVGKYPFSLWCPICQDYEHVPFRKWELDLFLDISNWLEAKGAYKGKD